MEAKYGQIAESTKINEAIYDCFDLLDEKEQKKFVKKFKDNPHDQIHVMHTFRELLLGAYLSANGLNVESERNICGKTPDWSILDSSSNVTAIVEAVTHHLDRKAEDELLEQKRAGKNVLSYWPNGNDPDHRRVYSHIKDKADKYKEIVSELKVPYVVSIFIDFLAVIDVQEVKDCLMSGDEPLFKLYPDLSGVLHFEESNRGSYYFELIENSYALRKIDIPTGYFMKS
jgi:hypothetical protein